MVPSISVIGRGLIFQKGSLFLVTKLIFRKQSEEPESTNFSKFSRTSGEWRVAHNELELVRIIMPKCGISSPVCLKQLAPGEMRRLLTLFLETWVQWK